VSAYEEFPIETSSADLGNDAKAWLADRWPGWVASPANFDAATIDANALMAAEVRDIAASVPDDIFRRQGAIAGIYPLEAIAATATATVTAIDTLGYTLQAGTVFSLRATGDTVALFTVDADVVIAPGSSSTAVGGVALTAQEPGTLPNGLTGTLTPADRTLPWFSSATTVTPAGGGVDAEATSAFLIRLATEFRLSAPRPILPADFADFAKRDLAVDRATAIDLYVPGTDEVQTVSHNGTGGTLTLTFEAQTTAAIAWNANAATVQAALVALSNVGPSDVIVTGGPWPALMTFHFTGALGEANRTQMTSSAASLTPGGSTITHATTVGGVAPASGVEKAIAVYVVDADGLDPGQTARDRVDADLQARRESQFLISVRAPGYDDVSVVFTAKALPGWDPAEVELRAEQAVTDWLTPANVGVPQFGDDPAGIASGRPWIYDGVIRLGELVEVLNRVDGVWRCTGPGANGMPTIEGSAADYALSFGPTAVVLPIPGTVAGTVTA
jgi:hypothetical protein